MILYSRLVLIDPQVRFIVSDNVPSIRTRIKLSRGETLWLFGLHSRSPGLRLPVRNERNDSTQSRHGVVLIEREAAGQGWSSDSILPRRRGKSMGLVS